MATSGTIKTTCGSTKQYDFWAEWKRNSYSVENNTSNITISLKIQRNDGYASSAYNLDTKPSVTLKVGGASKTPTVSHIDTRNSAVCTFATWTGNVLHNDDGSLSLSIAASFTTTGSSSLSSGSLSGTASITAIPRVSAPTASASSVKMGNSVTITTNRKSDSFTHTLKYTFGGSTATIKTGVGASYKWTVPDLASKISGKTSGTCTITCITYSGDTEIGSSTVKITLTIPAKSTPTVSASSVQMGNSVTITTNRNSDHFTHTLKYTIGGATATIKTGVGTSFAWTVPDLVSKISGKTSGTCTITCSTYSGSTLIGSSTVDITLTVPAKSTPTVSAASVKMGNSVTLTTNRRSSGFTHTFTYAIGTATGTIATGVTTSKTWTPPKSLAAYTGNNLSAACTITCKTYTGSTLVGSETVSLTLTVPDATVHTLSASTIALGGTITIATPKEASAYTHDLTYSLKASGSTTEADSGTIATGVSTDYIWTVPLSLAAKIPSATNGTITVTCKTRFANSTTEIGTKTKSFTITVPNNSNTQPKVTMTLSPVSDLQSPFSSLYLTGKSKVKTKYEVSSDYSTISSYSTSVENSSGSTNPYSSPLLNKAGTVTVTGVVTDARGYSTRKTEKITVLDYSHPRIIHGKDKSNIVCKRCNSDGKLDPGGVWLLIQVGRKYSKVVSDGTQKNFCKLSYRWKEDGVDDSSYSEPVTILEKDAATDYVSVTHQGIVADTKKAYTIQLIAEDDVGEKDTVTVTVPTVFAAFHIPKGGHGFTLGGYHDSSKYDVFDCLFDAEFEGNVSGRVLGLGKLPMIPDGSNFNDLKEYGVYAVTANERAQTMFNMPVQKAGTLRIWSANGVGKTATEKPVYIMQEFIPYNNSAAYRRCMMLEGDSWEYGEWKEL